MAKLTPAQKAAKTRKRNALIARRQKQEELRLEARARRQERLERQRAEKVLKELQRENERLKNPPLIDSAKIRDNSIASRLKEAVEDDSLDRNAVMTNNKEIYKKMAKKRVRDIKTEAQAEAFMRDIRNPDKFIKGLRSIAAYAKEIKRDARKSIEEEADGRVGILTDVQKRRNKDRIIRFKDAKNNKEVDDDDRQSMASEILAIAATDHSCSAAMQVAANVGTWDDPRIAKIETGHNPNKYKRARSQKAEQYIRLRRALEFQGVTNDNEANRILAMMYQIEKGQTPKGVVNEHLEIANQLLHDDGLSVSAMLQGYNYTND